MWDSPILMRNSHPYNDRCSHITFCSMMGVISRGWGGGGVYCYGTVLQMEHFVMVFLTCKH